MSYRKHSSIVPVLLSSYQYGDSDRRKGGGKGEQIDVTVINKGANEASWIRRRPFEEKGKKRRRVTKPDQSIYKRCFIFYVSGRIGANTATLTSLGPLPRPPSLSHYAFLSFFLSFLLCRRRVQPCCLRVSLLNSKLSNTTPKLKTPQVKHACQNLTNRLYATFLFR